MTEGFPDFVLLARPSLAVRDGLIVAIGERGDILDLAAPGTEVRDFDTAVVHPGLRDAHAHLVMTGLARRRLRRRTDHVER